MEKETGHFCIVDRSEPWAQFFLVTSWVMLVSLILLAFSYSVARTYEERIATLEREKRIVIKQNETYRLASQFSEEYGLKMLETRSSEVLSIARVVKKQYVSALMDIAIRNNPKLTRLQAKNISVVIYDESLEREFNPFEIAAVIVQESQYDLTAKSPVGALGLMQVMPDTGEGLARASGFEWQGPDTLYDPIINIKLGILYLWDLRNSYPGLYLVGYNGGPGAIKEVVRSGNDYHGVLGYHGAIVSRFGRFKNVYGKSLSERR